jgi:hypothetical protein
MAIITATVLQLALCAIALGYSFQASDPFEFAGVWQENWGLTSLRPGIQFDPKVCCYRILEVRYQNERFTGALTSDSIGIAEDRVTGIKRVTEPIQDTVLENGILRFRSREWAYEFMLAEGGHALIRGNPVPRINRDWASYVKVR